MNSLPELSWLPAGAAELILVVVGRVVGREDEECKSQERIDPLNPPNPGSPLAATLSLHEAHAKDFSICTPPK